MTFARGSNFEVGPTECALPWDACAAQDRLLATPNRGIELIGGATVLAIL